MAFGCVITVRLDDVCVLAILGFNFDSGDGLLASTSTGVVTDASWKCSNNAADGWDLPGFDDDSAWSQALVLWANDGSVPDINRTAQWIWSQGDPAFYAFCRKSLC